MNDFLNLSGPSSGSNRPSTGAIGGAAAGGAAAAFLNQPSAAQRPAAGERPGTLENRPGNLENRPGNAENRPGNAENRIGARNDLRNDRVDNRGDRMENRASSRPDRIDNRQERFDQRSSRRDEVRDQFQDHHPRYDFWKDNPNWARFRFNRPYRWASWNLITGWFPGRWNSATTYSYGDNVYYEGDTVYYGEEAVATSEEYAEQAQEIATSAAEPADDSEWLSLGVFAITQDGESTGPPPTIFLQLAVNKDAVIAGTVTNSETEESAAVEGAIDTNTQRCAWVIAGEQAPIMETGLSSLTEDQAPALLHFEGGQTQQWLLVRLEDPESGQ